MHELLPPEVLEQVFCYCLPPYPGSSSKHAPFFLLQVCSKWRALAISFAPLWEHFHVDIALHADDFHFLASQIQKAQRNASLWLTYARLSRPITLSINFVQRGVFFWWEEGTIVEAEAILSKFWDDILPRMPAIRDVVIWGDPELDLGLISSMRNANKLCDLEELNIPDYPKFVSNESLIGAKSLRSLKLSACTRSYYSSISSRNNTLMPWAQLTCLDLRDLPTTLCSLLMIMSFCKNLELSNLFISDRYQANNPALEHRWIELARLQVLEFSISLDTSLSYCEEGFTELAMPSLSSLSISCPNNGLNDWFPNSHLASYLPQLQSLELSGTLPSDVSANILLQGLNVYFNNAEKDFDFGSLFQFITERRESRDRGYLAKFGVHFVKTPIPTIKDRAGSGYIGGRSRNLISEGIRDTSCTIWL